MEMVHESSHDALFITVRHCIMLKIYFRWVPSALFDISKYTVLRPNVQLVHWGGGDLRNLVITFQNLQ